MNFIKRKPKKLNLRQVHKLYLLLRHALPEKEEELLIDQVEVLIDRMKGEEVLIRAIEIMYSKMIRKENPLDVLFMFIQGLKQNNFFDYVSFVRRMKQGN